MATKRQKQIEDALEDMGFDSMADSLRFDASPADEHYYSLDLNRIRRETTEDEFPTSDYNKVARLISEWFAIANKSKSNPRNSKMAIKRKKNPRYTRTKNARGVFMHRKDGILITKAAFERAMKAKGRIVKASKDTTGLAAKVADAKKILKKKSMTKADKQSVRRTLVVLEQAAMGKKAKANPKKRKNRRNPQSDAAKAMKLYHSGKARSLKAAWKMVKR